MQYMFSYALETPEKNVAICPMLQGLFSILKVVDRLALMILSIVSVMYYIYVFVKF